MQSTADPPAPYRFPAPAKRRRRPVAGRTRPDIAEVVVELMKRSPDWNRRLAGCMRERYGTE